VLDRIGIYDPVPRGIAQALFSVSVASVGLSFALSRFQTASPELLENIAFVGAPLLIAYVVEAVWLAQRVEIDDEYEEWLGFITGAGIAGLFGIAAALLVSEHLAYGHDNAIDAFGTAWAVVSLTILAGVLILQPLLAGRFRAKADSGSDL